MHDTARLRTMVERCRTAIAASATSREVQPVPPAHLTWMCDQLDENVDQWSAVKVARWIGFLQCALIADRILDARHVGVIFADARGGLHDARRDLLDRLAAEEPFEFDLGGEG